MSVVVTGGTGFLGKTLVAALRARGAEVVVFSRGQSVVPGARVVPWTRSAVDPWAREVDGADAIIHLAGAGLFDRRWTAPRKVELEESRVRGTTALAEAICKASRPPPLWISMSAVGIYGSREDLDPCPEDHALGDDFLARLCVAWEGAAATARRIGVRVVHPRMGVVLGRSGGALAQMLPIFRLGLGGPIGTGTQAFPWVHEGDAVRALLFVMDHRDLAGALNVVAPSPTTMGAFSKALGRALSRPAIFRVPPIAARVALGEGASAILTGQSAVPEVLLRAGFEFGFPDLDAALRDLVSTR